ncbi:MAG: type II secretion system protein [Elusimicrobiota bacterium]
MKPSRFLFSNKGFTLIEVIIAVSLLAILFKISQVFVKNFFKNIHFEVNQIYRNKSFNKFEVTVSRDLMSPYFFTGKTLEDKTQEMVFSNPYFIQVEYFPKKNKKGLYSLMKKTTNQQNQVKEKTLLTDIENIHWEFFDGTHWKSNWGWDEEGQKIMKGMAGVPLAIKVNVSDQKFLFPLMTAFINEKLKKQ